MAAKRRKGGDFAEELANAVERVEQNLPVPGAMLLTLETPNGEIEKAMFRPKPGIPKIRVSKTGEIISTAALVKVANEEVLTEQEAAENPLLVKWGAEGARNFIHSAISLSAGWLQKI
jgi:hypothetical protein